MKNPCVRQWAVIAIAVSTAHVAVSLAAQRVPPKDALAVAPIEAILEAFRTYPVVGLGEGPHGNEQGHAFRLALIRDPRFAASVQDIVVEGGSARYQDLMDRFIRGEDVPDVAMREVRENRDRAIYGEFFKAVRAVNASLSSDRQLRVLLGDPPIDWSTVRTRDEYLPWLSQRDAYPADLIRREVIARNRRALVIYGDGHYQAKTERPGRSMAGILESAGVRTFTITSTFADLSSFQSGMAALRLPSFALLRGTRLAEVPYERLFGPPPPTPYFRANSTIGDHYDALLYLGPASSRTIAPLSYPRCADPEYVRMRVGRMLLAGSPATIAGQLAAECAVAAPR